MNEADEIIRYITDGFRIIAVTAICFYATYLIIKSLAGDMPAWIVSIIFGLFILYVNVTKSKISKFFSK
jgi:hypothetical protein